MHFEPIDQLNNARCVTVCDSVKDLSIPNHYSSNLSMYISTQPVALAYLSLYHTTRPRRFVEIPWPKN